MKSDLPKVLHKIAGQPMVARVLSAVEGAGVSRAILVIGGDLEHFESVLADHSEVVVTCQVQRQGTADAVAAGGYAIVNATLPSYADGRVLRGQPLHADYVLICTGDTPCLNHKTLADFMTQGERSGCPIGVIGMVHPSPAGYGRLILTADGKLAKIVEEKDANSEEKQVNLCNSGIIYCERNLLFTLLQRLNNDNQAGEFYLTDCFAEAVQLGQPTFVYQTKNYQEFDGVNTPDQLKRVTAWLEADGRD